MPSVAAVAGRTGTPLARLAAFAREEAVLSIAFVCACVSTAVVGDVATIRESIDRRVIMLLFCLMASVAGLSRCGVMDRMAHRLVSGSRSKRRVCLTLVLMPFFASMLVTNDVALLSLVPVAALALEAAGWRRDLPLVVVLQAVAANLGGMVTSIGNPQNLFIFTTYGLSARDFFAALAPFGALALAMLALACMALGGSRSEVRLDVKPAPFDGRRCALHVALFSASVLAVMRVIPCTALFAVASAILVAFDRDALSRVDYGLLATFICFFVFSGNLASLPSVQNMFGRLMQSHPMLTALAASQVISNVPASVLLAPFTSNWRSLLIGVDLGGLGTPIASLASLIAFRLYMHTANASAGAFMGRFAIANAVTLAALVSLYALLFL